MLQLGSDVATGVVLGGCAPQPPCGTRGSLVFLHWLSYGLPLVHVLPWRAPLPNNILSSSELHS